MHVIDWFILVISLFLIVIVMMQNSKDDINDAFSGSKTDLFKNQKTRGIDLVLERATLVLAVAFFVLIIIPNIADTIANTILITKLNIKYFISNFNPI